MNYRLLNIFYNRDAEIEVLEGMAEEEQTMKQLRTDRGIENQMKRSAMKRAGLLLDVFSWFFLFVSPG